VRRSFLFLSFEHFSAEKPQETRHGMRRLCAEGVHPCAQQLRHRHTPVMSPEIATSATGVVVWLWNIWQWQDRTSPGPGRVLCMQRVRGCLAFYVQNAAACLDVPGRTRNFKICKTDIK